MDRPFDAEQAEYTRQGGDFRKDEMLYRLGFDAAFRLRAEASPFDEALSILRDRHGPVAEEPAFRAGYDRGRAHRSGSDRVEGADATDGPPLIAWFLVRFVADGG